MLKRKTMADWILEAANDSDKTGKLAGLSLVHMVGNMPKEIHTTKLAGGTNWKPADLANMFNNKANTYAQDLPGVQTFQLMAFYGESNEPSAFFPFRVNNDTEFGSLGSEQPTEQGRMAQLMRREDTFLGQVFRRQQIMDDFAIRMIAELGGQVQRLTRENHDAFQVVKDVIREKVTNDHELRMKELSHIRDTAERRKLMGMVPHLVNTLTGTEVFPQGTADTSLVESIAENINEEQLNMLGHFLKPELASTITSRIKEYWDKRGREQKQIEEIARLKSAEPEADVVGEGALSLPNGKH